MINIKNPLLLIDQGYALFYRYSATQLWYKHSHPEEKDKLTKDYKWHLNEEFMDKMKKMFVSDILVLSKKNKVPHSNIIIAEDCRLKDNWRSNIFNKYKAQRAEERAKNGWQGGTAFEVIVNEVIPKMIKDYGIIHLKHPKIEADDIISQIVLFKLNNMKYDDKTNDNTNDKNDEKVKDISKLPSKYIIVASDNDYFQILYDNVDLVNMKNVSQKEKMKYSPKGHLIEKILKGDVSDNIDSCLFNKYWVNHLTKDKDKDKDKDKEKEKDKTKDIDIYIKPNKKILNYYVENPEKVEEDIKNVNLKDNTREYIKRYEENTGLIDFNKLPEKYINDVWNIYKKYLDY